MSKYIKNIDNNNNLYDGFKFPLVLNGVLNQFLIDGDYIYFIGSFSNGVDEQGSFTTYSKIIKFNLLTNEIISEFNAGTINNTVYKISSDNDYIYIGGAFTSVNGSTMTRLCKLNKTDGAIADGWGDPSVNSIPTKILESGDYICIYGSGLTNKIQFYNKSDGSAASGTHTFGSSDTPQDAIKANDNGSFYFAFFNNPTINGNTITKPIVKYDVDSGVDATFGSDRSSGGSSNFQYLFIKDNYLYAFGTFSNLFFDTNIDKITRINLTTKVYDQDYYFSGLESSISSIGTYPYYYNNKIYFIGTVSSKSGLHSFDIVSGETTFILAGVSISSLFIGFVNDSKIFIINSSSNVVAIPFLNPKYSSQGVFLVYDI